MADRVEMHANLMGAAGLQATTQQRCLRKSLHHLVMRDGGFAARDHRHAGAMRRVAPDRRIDPAVPGDFTVDKREIRARHAPRLQLPHEIGLRRERFRDYEQTARVLVEPVHDAGARQSSELRGVIEQRIEQCPVPVAAARMNDQSRRLVQNEQCFVLVHHLERDVLRPEGERLRIGFGKDLDTLAAPQFLPRYGRLSVERYVAIAHPAREAAARMLGQQAGERLIQSQPGALLRYGERDVALHLRGWAIIGARFSHMRHSLTRSALLLFAALLGACGLFPGDVDETRGWSAARLYSEARQSLDGRDYERAVKLYEKLEARFPYGRYAQQAQMEIAYAYYKDNEVDSAVAAADRFIKLHPNHPNVDYMYYLKGLANFNDDLGIIGFIGGQDLSERDPKAARAAFDAFKDLVQRFPESRYTPDAIQRMNYLVNALAAHEVHVARYYMTRGAYVAAANRVQYALKTYPQAPANEEGLLIMVKAYDALGMQDLRNDAERVMLKNFPDSKYLKGGVTRDAPWWQIWNW